MNEEQLRDKIRELVVKAIVDRDKLTEVIDELQKICSTTVCSN